MWQQPVTFAKKAVPDMPLATWEQARACLWDILNHASVHVLDPTGTSSTRLPRTRTELHGFAPGIITLSNVKRLFRSRFNLELSETALGHSRLNELLQDPRFSDICSLEMQGKSQVVIQRTEPDAGFWSAVAPWSAAACSAELYAAESGLDSNAKPWIPAESFGAEASCSEGGFMAGSVNVLSAYVQQLFELSESQQVCLDTLSPFGAPPAVDRKERVISASCSTGDEGSVGAVGSDSAGSTPRRTADADALAALSSLPAKVPPGLAPPPGLEFLSPQ